MSLVAQRINELQADAQVAIVVIQDSANRDWLVQCPADHAIDVRRE